jgi:archaemetzincin
VKVRLAVIRPGPAAELVGAVLRRLPAPLTVDPPVTDLPLDLCDPCRDRLRGQVDAGCLVDRLPVPPPGCTVLGLTGVDLYLPALTHVFGASRLGERRGVVSSFRLADPPERGPARLVVEATHEIGHALGLVHCPVAGCAMHRALWPEGVDLKRPEYCPACLGELGRLEST